MKTRTLFTALGCGILVLIVAGAWMAKTLMDLSIEKKPAAATPLPLKSDPVPVSETVIEIGNESPKPAKAIQAPQPAAPKPESKPRRDMRLAKSEPIASSDVGRVTSIRGNAICTSTNRPLRTLLMNASIMMFDQVETGPGARLTIEFLDGTIISIGESSRMVVDEYVYDPDNRPRNALAIRLVKGACRIMTGFITKLNPERFTVRTRMATAGIRGCDLAFRSSPTQDEIFILELGGEKSVTVTTTSNGAPICDMTRGQKLDVPAETIKRFDFTEPGHVVSVTAGKNPETRQLSQEEIRTITGATAVRSTASHELTQGADGAEFKIRPPAPIAVPAR